MSYIQNSLGDGETILSRAKFHWLYISSAWAALILPGILLLVVLCWVLSRPDPFAMDDMATWYLLGATLLFLWGFWVFLDHMIVAWTTEIGITSHRFVEKHGLIAVHTSEIALPNIEGVRMHQSFLGRIFNYGTVRVEGTGDDAVTTPVIADPVGLVRGIQTAKEHLARL